MGKLKRKVVKEINDALLFDIQTGDKVSGTVKSGLVALYKIATVGEAQTSGGSLKVAEIEAYSKRGERVTITPTKISAGSADATIKSLYCLNGITLKSSTSGSTKKFRITVDDTGTLSATEVTT